MDWSVLGFTIRIRMGEFSAIVLEFDGIESLCAIAVVWKKKRSS